MIILIRPQTDFKIEEYDNPGHPHLGLAYIAAYVRSKKLDVGIIDGKADNITNKQILEQIRSIRPMLIGLTAMTHEIDRVARFAKNVKTYLPSVKIVIGGVHATALPLETMEQYSVFDFLVYGEGEITLYELIVSLYNNVPLNEIKGLVFRDGLKIVKNKEREWIDNLDELPFPAWDMFKRVKSYPILSSRGCPFQCIFCNRILGNRVRNRSVENVIKEIEFLIEIFNISHFSFIDETFSVSYKRINQILDEIILKRINKKVTWDGQTRVDCVNLDLLKKFKRSGCRTIGFGIESGNNDILRIIKKNITKKQALNALNMAKKAGLSTNTFYILGHPFETIKSIIQTLILAIRINSSRVAFGIMTPYPNTKIFSLAKQKKAGYHMISNDWSDFNKNLGNALELNLISRRRLEILQLIGFFLVYFFNFRIKDLFKLVKTNKMHIITLIRKIIKSYLLNSTICLLTDIYH